MRGYRPLRRSDVKVRVVEGETVVLDRKGKLIHQLNQTASYIWHRCDGESSVADIANEVGQAFEADPETAERDVALIVEKLRNLNLIDVD